MCLKLNGVIVLFFNIVGVLMSLHRFMLPLNRYMPRIYVEMLDCDIQPLHLHSHKASCLPL